MEKEKRIAGEVEKTLHSFDDDIILPDNPFLLTRLKKKLDDRLNHENKGFALRLNLNQILMAIILVINILTVAYYYEWNTKEDLKEKLVLELKEDFQIDQSQNTF